MERDATEPDGVGSGGDREATDGSGGVRTEAPGVVDRRDSVGLSGAVFVDSYLQDAKTSRVSVILDEGEPPLSRSSRRG